MIDKILVPLDGSRFSSRAIRYANEIAARFDSKVVFIRVVKPAVPPATVSGAMAGMETAASAKLAADVAIAEDRRHLDQARRYLLRKVRENEKDEIETSYVIKTGEPAEVITNTAKKEHFDLIVMTTHGKGGIKRVFLGSIADEVVRKSKKPVLAIRP